MASGPITLWQIDGEKVKAVEEEMIFRIPVEQKSFLREKN